MGSNVLVPGEMRSRYKLFALFGVLVLVLSAFGPAAVAAGATASNHETGNDSTGPDENANETATNATDGNVSNASNASNASEDAFGQEVSAFVHELLANGTDNRSIGHMVANFVLENNPAADKIPDHAGPPENGTGPKNVSGPPEDAGPPEDGGGPPDDAGPSSDDDTEDEADEES